MPCAFVICAAGAGSRMGKTKALCSFGRETFLSSIVHTIEEGVKRFFCISGQKPKIVVVIGAQAQEVRDAHRTLDVTWAHNEAWAHTHMFESFLCGLDLVTQGCEVIHWPVDCLNIGIQDLCTLVAYPLEGRSIVGLSQDGKPGHPVKLSSSLADGLRREYAEYSSMRDIIHRHTCCYINTHTKALMNCNDPKILAEYLSEFEIL